MGKGLFYLLSVLTAASLLASEPAKNAGCILILDEKELEKIPPVDPYSLKRTSAKKKKGMTRKQDQHQKSKTMMFAEMPGSTL